MIPNVHQYYYQAKAKTKEEKSVINKTRVNIAPKTFK